MISRPFDELMRRELSRAGFDPAHPQPAVAWEAFKSFLGQPVPGQKTITAGFTCSNYPDRDDVLWLEFARNLEDEESGVGQNCGCALTCRAPEDLMGAATSHWWWEEHGSLDEWFRVVEAMPVFLRCLEIQGWRLEGHSV